MIYHIFANKSNIGDWLSAKGIQTTLHGHSIVELFCDMPFVDETMNQLRALQPDDFVIIGGGGLFMDYFAPFWEAFLKIADNIPFGIWGVGYCDLTEEDSLPPNDLIQSVIRHSNFCYVRDELTRQYLPQLQLDPPTGCPSLLCLLPSKPDGRGLLHVDNYTTVGAKAFELMDQLGRSYAANTDRKYLRTNNRIGPGGEAQLRLCLDLYQNSDIVLSSALHGCVIGAALQKKVIAVSGDRKIDAFMQSIGLGDWVCGRDDLDRLQLLLSSVEMQEPCVEAIAALRSAQERIGQRIRVTKPTASPIKP